MYLTPFKNRRWTLACMVAERIALRDVRENRVLLRVTRLRASDGPGGPAHHIQLVLRVTNDTTINTMNPKGIVTIPGWLNGTQDISSASFAA